jgi:4-amino-4-deoxy-L-arabinose transferase-like glycosyltransferase/Flp pilus assembly protein TadD
VPVAASPPTSRWAFTLFLLAVFTTKCIVVLQLRNHPLVQPDAGLDTTAYVELAKRVLGGDLGLGPGLYYVSPLYIYFLAAVLRVTDSFTAVRLVQVTLGTAAVAAIFVMAREWFGRLAAWVAAGLAALTGLFTFYEALLLQASLDAVMTAAGLASLTLALKRDRLGWYLLSGLAFGIQALNRPNVAIAVGGVVAALLVARRGRPAAALVAGLLIGLAPVAVRNAVVAHQWSLVSSQGGLNFYIGNRESATGFYDPVAGVTPNMAGQAQDVRRVAEQATGRSLTDAEASGYFFKLAWTWIRQHPAAAVELFVRKIGYVFIAQHIALPYSYPFYADDARTLLRFCVVGPWLLVPLGLVGLVAGAAPAHARRDYLIWLSFVPGYTVSVAAFFVAERYRLPLFIPLCVGAGGAIDAGTRAMAAHRPRTLLWPGLACAVLFGAVNWPRALDDGRSEERLRMAERLVTLGRYDEAEQWGRLAEETFPRASVVHYRMGTQLLAAGQFAAATVHLTKADELAPGQANVEYALGQTLFHAGQPGAAIPYLRRGFEGGTTLPLAGYDLAVALQTVGDLPGAARVVARIRPGARDQIGIWLRLGRLAAEVHAPEAAEPFFRHAVQMDPGHAGARQQLGLDLMVLGRYDDAARELAEAARLDPHDAESMASLAYCELKIGRPSEARAHATAALQLDPANDLAKQLLAALKNIR